MNDLQRHMDEQQEKHERLMVGRDPPAGDLMCGISDIVRENLKRNAKLDNPFKSIPAPQGPSDGPGGTKTPLEEIEALKPKESGFRPKQGRPRCYDPSHNPPMHLYIPPDQEYVHVCPSCRATVVIQGPEIMW